MFLKYPFELNKTKTGYLKKFCLMVPSDFNVVLILIRDYLFFVKNKEFSSQRLETSNEFLDKTDILFKVMVANT